MSQPPISVEPLPPDSAGSQTEPPAVVTEDLHHAYGAHIALKGVSLSVRRGEIFGVLGENGGGKTTLFKILSTLMPPTGGRVSLLGRDALRNPHAVRKRIGVVFQHASLDPKLTVIENLLHQGRLYGMRGRALKERARTNLDRLGLAGRSRDRAETLSSGLKRRAELAKALLHRPEVLIMDEPGTGLDPGARGDFDDYLAELRESDGTTVLLTTHFLEEAERCDRVAFLHRGEVVALGAPEELKARVGGDVVAIHSGNPEGLGAKVRERFGCKAQVVRGALRVERPEGHEFVREVVNAFPGDIRSVAFGKPTLEDVFVRLTGRGLDDGEAAENEGGGGGGGGVMGFWLPVLSLWRREIVRFVRQRSRVVGALVQPLLFWVLLGSGFRASFRAPGTPEGGGGGGGMSYAEYFYPGIIALVLLFTAIFSTISTVQDRSEGFLQGVLVAPAPRSSIVLGQALGGTTLALVEGLLLLLLAPLAGIPLTVQSVVLSLAVMALLSFGMTSLGLAIAWRMESVQGFHAIMNLFLMPLWLLSGAIFPAEGAPVWLGWVMRVNPMTYGVAALRRSMYWGGGGPASPLPSFSASLTVMIFFSVLIFLTTVWIATRRSV